MQTGNRQRSALETLNSALSSASSFEELAEKTVAVCATAAHADICTLWRVYHEENGNLRLRLAAAYGVEARERLASEITYAITPSADRYDGVTGYVASERTPVLVHSFEQLRREYDFCWAGKMDPIQWKSQPENLMRNLYAAPITLGDQLQGVLKVENRVDGSFTGEDVEEVDTLAQSISLVAKSLVLLDSHERRLIEGPVRLSGALVKPFETEKLTQEIVNTTAEMLNAEVCSLWLVDRTGRNLVHQANQGFGGQKGVVPPPYQLNLNAVDDSEIKGITAWVAIKRKAFWANSYEELRKHKSWQGTWDPVLYGGSAEAANRFRSMYAVPLVWGPELLGVLKVENPRAARYFSLNDHRKCDLMANYVVLLLALTRQLRMKLVPGMAHILNSPAAGIATMLDQLQRESSKPIPDIARVKKYVDFVRRGVLTIAGMSRTLSAEIVAGVGTQQTTQTELVAFLHKQIATVEGLAPERIRIELCTEVERHDLPLTRSEQVWLEIVLFNLLHNAIKYSPANGLVQVRCDLKPDGVTVTVADQGEGIAPENLQHIFEPLWRTKPELWPEGTGLGLYEVRRLLDQLGWSITVRHSDPKGAAFEIQIPSAWRQRDDI